MSSALALLLASPAYVRADCGMDHSQMQSKSQKQRSYQQTATSSRQQQFGQQSAANMQRTISGTVEQFRRLNLQGVDRNQHSLVRLQMQDGRSVVIDVGSRSNLGKVNIEDGDRVEITGQLATVSGRQVFRANKLNVEGKTIALQQSQSSKAQGQQTTILEGELTGFRHVQVKNKQGDQTTHTLAKVQLDDGRTTVVNLGPKNNLRQLGLQRGEQVRLVAQQGTFNGQRMFLVKHIGREQQSQSDSTRTSTTRNQTTSSQARSQGQQITVEGIVQGYQVMSIGSGNQQQVLLNLQLQDGRSLWVDAGKYQPGELNLRNLDIQDRVTIKARRVNTGGRQMLVADSIRFENAQGGSGDSEFESSGQRERSSKEQSKSRNQSNH